MHVVETAILSTDLAMYFKKRTIFMELIENGEFDWQSEEKKEGKAGCSNIISCLLVICKVLFPKFTPKQTNKHIILQEFYLKPKIFIIIFRFFFLKIVFHRITLSETRPDGKSIHTRTTPREESPIHLFPLNSFFYNNSISTYTNQIIRE